AAVDHRGRRGHVGGDGARASRAGSRHCARGRERAARYRDGYRTKSLSGANFYAYRLSLALAAPGEPGSHGFRQAFGLYAGTRFEETTSDRARVAEFGLACEVPHTEIVEAIERTSASLDRS